ncbi:hypothetical protein Psi01_83920 [Planobispora siamensis]|uniref:Uncharacterized protein n=1 Tax=Planobispora siamensis TaxID=936338 RepID=A0A8J3SP60_9ACTN|nr:hypothetical protein Psi01_83920 [Planobispora siamensis]
MDALHAHFADRCCSVVSIPFDPHLEEDSEFDLDRLTEAAQEAYRQLSATVGDGFTRSHMP